MVEESGVNRATGAVTAKMPKEVLSSEAYRYARIPIGYSST
jgi:hypothetical protein